MKIVRPLAVAAALGASLLLVSPASATEGPFKNCTEAYDADFSNIPRGTERYAKNLDRDNDGYGCDDEVKANDGKQGTGVYEKTEGDTNYQEPVEPTDGKDLAETGGNASTLYLAGAGVLLLSGGAALAVRRKRAV